MALLSESRRFVEQMERDGQDVHRRREPDTWPNVMSWYRSGKLSLEYVALSKTCSRALKTLNPDERRTMPSVSKLNAVRITALSDQRSLALCRRIMGDDLIRLRIQVGEGNENPQEVRRVGESV